MNVFRINVRGSAYGTGGRKSNCALDFWTTCWVGSVVQFTEVVVLTKAPRLLGKL